LQPAPGPPARSLSRNSSGTAWTPARSRRATPPRLRTRPGRRSGTQKADPAACRWPASAAPGTPGPQAARDGLEQHLQRVHSPGPAAPGRSSASRCRPRAAGPETAARNSRRRPSETGPGRPARRTAGMTLRTFWRAAQHRWSSRRARIVRAGRNWRGLEHAGSSTSEPVEKPAHLVMAAHRWR